MNARFHDVFCRASDGLKLHAWDTGPRDDGRLPVLCLPGLTRTVADFETLGVALANHPTVPRRVIAIDYRGRGLSDHDPDPANYAVPAEAGDVVAVASHLGIERAIAVGTSRGGIISMVLAATQPKLLAGVVLNDVGPVLEMEGLVRIKGYIAADRPLPATWEEAASGAKSLFGRDFPNLGDDDWLAWARRGFRQRDGALERTYDPALELAFAGIDPAKPPPPAWKLFDAMKNLPLMLVHGGRSDLLSAQGVADMMARRPDIDLVTVPDEGHAPLLADAPTIDRIGDFCARCDHHAG